ncbi:MAG: GTP-binding protein [Candidatus Atabeyarchaeum deiterrae]
MNTKKNGADAEYMFKIILVGDGAVGKSSLIRKYMEGKFESDYLPTIGSQIYTKTLSNRTHRKVKLVVWDISGQPVFGIVRPDYYKGATGVLLVFDLTRPETYSHLDGWVEEIRKNTSKPEIIVIGNKSDLEVDRKVSRKSGEAYASKVNGSYLETSAKGGNNVEKTFSDLADRLVENIH